MLQNNGKLLLVVNPDVVDVAVVEDWRPDVEAEEDFVSETLFVETAVLPWLPLAGLLFLTLSELDNAEEDFLSLLAVEA